MMAERSIECLKSLIEKSRFFESGILGIKTRAALSQLNNKYPVHDANFIYRDYRGLAYCLGMRDRTFLETLENSDNPMEALLNDWMGSGDQLLALLESLLKLERFDVLEDIHSLLEEDIAYECSKRPPPIQSDQVSSSEKPLPEFDAFVCYAEEKEDTKFVKHLMHVLEKDKNCKLFIPDRDLNVGVSKHTVTAEVIEKHCLRMIVILSRSFLRSPACDFQVKFAHCLAPGSHSKRMIPVLIDKGFDKNNIPPVLKHVTLCDYTKSDTQEWFWNRLVRSVKESADFSSSHSSSDFTRMDYKRSPEPASFHESSEVSSSSLFSLPHFRSSPSLTDSGLASMETTPSGLESAIFPREVSSGLPLLPSTYNESHQETSRKSLPDVRYPSAPVIAVRHSMVPERHTAPVTKKASLLSRIFSRSKKKEPEMMDTSL